MDRTAWIAVILSIAGLFGWYYYVGKSMPKAAPAAAVVTPSPTPAGADTPPPATPAPQAPAGPVVTEREETLSTSAAAYVFSSNEGGIERVELIRHLGENDHPVALNRENALPIGAIGERAGFASGGFEMRTDSASGTAAFERRSSNGVVVTKRFTLPAKGSNPYVVGMEITFRNEGPAAVEQAPYFISTGGAAPVHSTDLPHFTRFEWFHSGKPTNIDVNWFNASGIAWLGIQWRAARDLYVEQKPDAKWAAVASQYFCTIITAESTVGQAAWASRFDTRKSNNAPVYGMQGALGMPGFRLEPGQAHSETFSIYAGPKELTHLRTLKNGQDVVMNFGMFGFVSEFLLWAMNGLNSLFHSYAAAIIVLTLLIKSVLWPIQNKATNQMRQMALLSPKMTELREKFKDDPQKMNEEMMKLYREYGVNPFSGCLPMLIQIPIFFGFYAMLGSAIELRNSSFLWIHDLSQPDTIFRIPGINFPVNLLPIVMAGTMVWQMAITPKSGDAMQQRIFYFMPIIFLVFCYNYASGLALYWTTQNIFSIVQLYLTRNKPLPTLEKRSVVAKREADAAKKRKKRRPGS